MRFVRADRESNLCAMVSWRRTSLSAVALVLGVAIWLGGTFAVFGGSSYASGLALVLGTCIILPAALTLIRPRVDRLHPGTQVSLNGVLGFLLALGAGLSALSLALPGTFWLAPRNIVPGVGGLALIAWSPESLNSRAAD